MKGNTIRDHTTTLGSVLDNAASLTTMAYLYLPEYENWTLDSFAAVLESIETSPDEQLDPDAGIPEFAKMNKLKPTLPMDVVQDIVEYARDGDPSIDADGLLCAFLYYYQHDAFFDSTQSSPQ